MDKLNSIRARLEASLSTPHGDCIVVTKEEARYLLDEVERLRAHNRRRCERINFMVTKLGERDEEIERLRAEISSEGNT